MGFFGIGKKKWEEQAKAAQTEAEASIDDIKSALPASEAEASDSTLAERVSEQQRWENSLRRFVQAESTRMQQGEKNKDVSALDVESLKQTADDSEKSSSSTRESHTAEETQASGSSDAITDRGHTSQREGAEAASSMNTAEKSSFEKDPAQVPSAYQGLKDTDEKTSDASAQESAPRISDYRATGMLTDTSNTDSSSSDSSGAGASANTDSDGQTKHVHDALQEFDETKYDTDGAAETSTRVSSASDKSDKIEFVGAGAAGSAKGIADVNEPETLVSEKNRSAADPAEKTSAKRPEKTLREQAAENSSAETSVEGDAEEKQTSNDSASATYSSAEEKTPSAQETEALAETAVPGESDDNPENAEVLTPENPLHDLVAAMRSYGTGKLSYELRQLGDDMHYRIFHRGSEVEQGVVVPTDAWFSSIASLYVRAKDAGRVWNRALVVASPGLNDQVTVEASYTNTYDASSYTTNYIFQAEEEASAAEKGSDGKPAAASANSVDSIAGAKDEKSAADAQETRKAAAQEDSVQKVSETKEAGEQNTAGKSDADTQGKPAGAEVYQKTDSADKAEEIDREKNKSENADAQKATAQGMHNADSAADSDKLTASFVSQNKTQEQPTKPETESAKSGSGALAAGARGAAGVTAAGLTASASAHADRKNSHYEYDYDADPQNVTGRHSTEQNRTVGEAEYTAEQDRNAKQDAGTQEHSAVQEQQTGKNAASESSLSDNASGVSVADTASEKPAADSAAHKASMQPGSTDASTPETEAARKHTAKDSAGEKSSDDEELNSMQAALATIVASSEAKAAAGLTKETESVSDTANASSTASKDASETVSDSSQKAAAVGSSASEEQPSALPQHVDDLALVPETETEKASLIAPTAASSQEAAHEKQSTAAAVSAGAASQPEASTAGSTSAQPEAEELPPAEAAELDMPEHQSASAVTSGDELAEGNLVLTDAEVIEHLAPVTEALFGENGSAKDATTVLIRVRSVGSYYDVLTHVRRNGFWEQARTFELVSEDDLGVPTLKADSYQEGEGSPLAMSLTFTPGVPVQAAFDYSNEQAFVRYPRQLDTERYVEELRMFPRLGAKIPPHMANALTHWSL